MKTIRHHASGTVDDVISAFVDVLMPLDPALVVVMTSTAHPLADVQRSLATRFPKATVIGASTAGEFVDGTAGTGGSVVFGVGGEGLVVHAGYATGTRNNTEGAVDDALSSIPPSVEGYPHRCAITFINALAGVSEEVTLLLSRALGDDVPIAGGAAGDDLAMTNPLVGLAGEVGSDAIAVAVLSTTTPLALGVAHGNEPFSAPMRVTRSEGATVFTLDDVPAWDAWINATRDVAAARGIDVDALIDADGKPSSPDGVLAYLLQFEAGLSGGSTTKIRAPLSRGADGSLSFACGIPAGSVVRITQSDAGAQIASTRVAAEAARAGLKGACAGVLIFDCVCRRLILGDHYLDAVDQVRAVFPNTPVAGFASYGEIALNTGDWSGFHNTTSVVLAFPAD